MVATSIASHILAEKAKSWQAVSRIQDLNSCSLTAGCALHPHVPQSWGGSMGWWGQERGTTWVPTVPLPLTGCKTLSNSCHPLALVSLIIKSKAWSRQLFWNSAWRAWELEATPWKSGRRSSLPSFVSQNAVVNIFICPKFMLKLNWQFKSIMRWGFQRVISHGNRALMNSIRCLFQRAWQRQFVPSCPSALWGHGIQEAILKAESSPQQTTKPASPLILDSRPPELQENEFLFFVNYPVWNILLQQHKKLKHTVTFYRISFEQTVLTIWLLINLWGSSVLMILLNHRIIRMSLWIAYDYIIHPIIKLLIRYGLYSSNHRNRHYRQMFIYLTFLE